MPNRHTLLQWDGGTAVPPSPAWQRFLSRVNLTPAAGISLAVDPGETCGVAVLSDGNPIRVGQVRPQEQFQLLVDLFYDVSPQRLIIESYRVYQSRALQHIHSDVPTLRYIGAFQTLAALAHIPLYFQSASAAKSFVDDRKLADWGLYQSGQPHLNDALRHGLHWYLFAKEARTA